MNSISNIKARVAALYSAPLDSWIALSDDETRIVAQGATYEEVSKQLDSLGDENAVVIKTPSNWQPLSI
jgi:hypothetical protein